MEHSHLLDSLVYALVAAFVGGFIAVRLRLPALVGYLLAGIAVGPYTLGPVADAESAAALAEIGIILLMFGVGIHFSLRDLLAVWRIAVPAAIGQLVILTGLGAGLAASWGWSGGGALVFGLAASIASTVVLMRALADRSQVDTPLGRVAVGWLIVEDLLTVIILVVLPSLGPLFSGQPVADPTVGGLAAAGAFTAGQSLFVIVGVAVAKTALFVALMVVVGARIVPWLLNLVARDGSSELFTLAVLAIALGIAFASATVFGVSFALGAFLAGVVVSESDLSHHAAANALPLQEAFAVLFFVSTGLLFDPGFLVRSPGHVLAMLGLIVGAKGILTALMVLGFRLPLRMALTLGAGRAQIGEFSFILAALGLTLGLFDSEGFNLIVAGALLSIALNPLLFFGVDRFEPWIRRWPRVVASLERTGGESAFLPAGVPSNQLRGHVVLCGYGQVGSLIGQALQRRGFQHVVIELDRRRAEDLRARGIAAVYGDAGSSTLLRLVNLERARVLIIAIPDPPATRRIVDHARRINPDLAIVARTHGEAEWAYLRDRGVDEAVLGERELALEMLRYTLRRYGMSAIQIQAILQGLRH